MLDKWTAIFLMILCGAMFSPIVVSEYNQSQCRIEAIKAGVNADKINQACGITK